MALIANSESAAPANTAWIQAKIDAQEPVVIPGGRYCIDWQIVPRNGSRVVGINPVSSVLQQINPTHNAFYAADLLYASIEHLTIDGPGTGIGHGIHIPYKTQVGVGLSFRDLQIRDFGEDGIRIERAVSTVFDRVTCQNIGGYGFAALDGTSFEWRSTYALKCGKAGYFLNSIHYSGLSVAAVDSSAIGYWIKDCRGITLTACGSESMRSLALRVEGSEVTALNFRNLDNQGGMAAFWAGSTGLLVMPHEQGPAKAGVLALDVDASSLVELKLHKFISPIRAPAGTVRT